MVGIITLVAILIATIVGLTCALAVVAHEKVAIEESLKNNYVPKCIWKCTDESFRMTNEIYHTWLEKGLKYQKVLAKFLHLDPNDIRGIDLFVDNHIYQMEMEEKRTNRYI